MSKYVCPNCKSFIEFDGKAVVVCSKCKIKMFSNEDREKEPEEIPEIIEQNRRKYRLVEE